jgi:cell division protein FtsQ
LQPVSNRHKIEYTQSAKNDLAAQTPQNDPRMRYVRFRSDKVTRVLGDPEEARAEKRHQLRDASDETGAPYASEDTLSSGQKRRSRGASNMTVREYRERHRGIARRKSKAPRRTLLIVIILLVLGSAAFILYQSPLFTVREVRVEGAQRLTDERLTELAAIPEGSTLLRLDVKEMQERLTADPWVESVEVKRSFPSALVLTVTERAPTVVVEMPASANSASTQNWLVSRDGVWLGSFESKAISDSSVSSEAVTEPSTDGSSDAESSSRAEDSSDTESSPDAESAADAESSADADASSSTEASSDSETPSGTQGTAGATGESSVLAGVQVSASELEQLLPIKDLSRSVAPQIGESVTDEGVLNALTIVNTFTPGMLARIRSISAPDRVKTMITLINNVEVAFGAAEDVAAKEQAILSLLSEHEGTLTYINVRVADRATYRATQ